MFLSQMVFMDIDRHHPDRCDGRALDASSPSSSTAFLSAALVIYPLYANWVWGGGWLSALRQELRAWGMAMPKMKVEGCGR